MKKRWLAICHRDEKYVFRLQEALEEAATFPFATDAYKDVGTLEKAMQKKDFAMVLLGEEFATEKEKMRGAVVAFLTEEKESEETDGLFIRKYQSAEDIKRIILKIYAEESEFCEKEFGGKRAKIIGVYTPIGRCLQTSFSLLLGQILAKKKKEVLYLNFEPFSGLSLYPDTEKGKDITDLVYLMRGKGQDLMYRVRSMVNNINGLDYISPSFSFMDLAAVTEEDWIKLLKSLKKEGNYEYIILDLSEMVQGLLNVLRECNLVYTITRKDGIAVTKMNQYEMLLKEYEYEDVMNKTKKWEFPLFRQLPADMEQLPYSELAIYIRKRMEAEDEL